MDYATLCYNTDLHALINILKLINNSWHTQTNLKRQPQISLAGFTTREGGSVLTLPTRAGTISGLPSITKRMGSSSFGQWYFLYEFMKYGTSFVEDPLRIMVMNLPFLLMPSTAISANIRSDANRNLHRSSSEG